MTWLTELLLKLDILFPSFSSLLLFSLRKFEYQSKRKFHYQQLFIFYQNAMWWWWWWWWVEWARYEVACNVSTSVKMNTVQLSVHLFVRLTWETRDLFFSLHTQGEEKRFQVKRNLLSWNKAHIYLSNNSLSSWRKRTKYKRKDGYPSYLFSSFTTQLQLATFYCL
jgi:hypothetical protein